MCEYLAEESDRKKGKNFVQRQQANTKKYVDAALEVGKDLNIPTVNMFNAFMKHVDESWDSASAPPYPGSKELPEHQKWQALLRDGLHFNPQG